MPDAALRYRDAGVDLDAAYRAKTKIAELVGSTVNEDTLSGIGAFGGLYRLPKGGETPVLAASTDGVGTKLRLAFRTGRHDTVGEDLVNHCVNDILVQGARPLFFLDYLAVGRLDPGVAEQVVSGIARGCRGNGCVLLGGETAEMPDFYPPGEYDLAGTVVGLVEQERILDGAAVRAGDQIIALASSGLHTNGYSLARQVVFERMGLGVDDPFPGENASVGDVLLRVHRTYLASLLPLVETGSAHALAHVTGGGITDNLPRVFPPGTAARIDRDTWEVPCVFRVLQEAGGIPEEEMFRVFNMGVGMLAIVPPTDADTVVRELKEAGEKAWIIGEIVVGDGDVVYA
ncbi:phosphoribosylformylglycinamidine cyclo-ligase [soil metagenome]